MQGGAPGERPATPVQTSAEKDKFNREALQYLIPRARIQERQHQQIQIIDWGEFAKSWNEDVAELERHILMGLHERGAANDVINRKSANQLQYFWTKSRTDVNVERTMRPHASVLRAVRAKMAVTPQTQAAAQEGGDDRPASFAATCSGDTVIFPRVAPVQAARAGPAPCAFARGALGAEAQEASQPVSNSGGDALVESLETKKTAMGRA